MKNYKKSAKQLRHLQSIYGQPTGGDSIVGESTVAAMGSVLTMQQNNHATVRRDLIFLIILIIVIVALLFALNYLAETTSFGTWMNQLVGKIL